MKLFIPNHLQNKEWEIQSLLIKADKEITKAELSDFRWVREYQEALMEYVQDVFKQIAIGVGLKLNVDPSNIMQKSVKVSLDILQKAANGEEIENALFYKSLFSNLKEKFTIAKNFFKKFGFNKGKPLQPLNIKGKLKYNPETGMPLTTEEWNNLTKEIVDFLGDKIGTLEEELVVKAGLMGKLMQVMEEDGIPIDEQKKMSHDDVESRYGYIPDNTEDAVKKFNLSDPEIAAIEYSKQHAAEHLAIEDGSLKNKIVKLVREQITGGLEDGLTAQELTQRLFWIDPTDELGRRFSQKTIDAINRDWRRVSITEISYALNNGYLEAVNQQKKKEGKSTYFVFSGGIIPTSSKQCINWLGTIVKYVDKPLSDDEINDPHARYAIWRGKNNVGRNGANWWICIPAHPQCIHYWSEIDPTVEEWDSSINKVVYKI